MIRVCISGLGKTGKEISKVLMEHEDIRIVAAICSPNSEKKGRDLGEIIGSNTTGILVESSENLQQVIFRTKPDVAVDFSNPEAALQNAKVFTSMKVNIVIGTTGFSKFAFKKLFVLTKMHHAGIVYAPNITMGVNVLMLLSNLAANILSSYDFRITEIHHKQKKDSPSGTAKKIAMEISKGLKSAGVENEADQIPIQAIRAGGVIGKHEVMIIGENDKIEISHESFSRKAFALGTIQAVKFILRESGYFEMSDVLNLKKILNDYLDEIGNSFNKKYIHYFPKKKNCDTLA